MITEAKSACDSAQSILLKAMNTQIELIVWSAAEKAAGIRKIAADWFRKTEGRFSRFREDSELSRLNQLAGERCFVSDAMLDPIFAMAFIHGYLLGTDTAQLSIRWMYFVSIVAVVGLTVLRGFVRSEGRTGAQTRMVR